MSNSHVGTNCAMVTGSNGIPLPLKKPLHYVNLFFLENGTTAKQNGTIFLLERLPFLAVTVGVQ